MVVKEALGIIALGASARIGPLAKGAYESFSKGARRKVAMNNRLGGFPREATFPLQR